MSEEIYKGHITFVNYDKHFATIDYLKGGKTKSVNCRTVTPDGKRSHHFRVGDNIQFELKLSDRGDKQTAFNIKFLYNTQLEVLLNKAVQENRFAGYLKQVENDWLIKERDSYIFFPLRISKWEAPPAEQAVNEVINFSIQNMGKRNQLYAELFSHSYIPEFKQAQELFKQQKPLEAVVTRISPYAAYVDLMGGKMQAKLEKDGEGLKEGDKLEVRITHITPYRIVIERI